MRAYLFLLLLAAGTTYLAVPLARRLAERASAMSPVRERDVHSVPTPRLGGLAMLAGVAVAFAVASRMPFLAQLFVEAPRAWVVLAAAAIVSLLGVADDVWGLDALTKLAGQVLAAGLMAWQGVQFVSLPVGGVLVGSSGLFLALTVLAVVVAVNAVNFVDGLDGLAAGVVGIGGAAFFTYSYLLTRNATPDNYASLGTLTVAVLVGVCLGFLPHNAHPARIFMGDSGSMLIGLLLAASAVSVTGRVDPTVAAVSRASVLPAFLLVLLPVAVLLLPLVDLLLAVVRRLAAGQSPFTADKLHLHHRLLGLGHTHARAVWVLYLWAAVVSFGAMAMAFVPAVPGAVAWGAAMVAAAVATLAPAHRARRRRRALDAAEAAAAATPPPAAAPAPVGASRALTPGGAGAPGRVVAPGAADPAGAPRPRSAGAHGSGAPSPRR